MKHNVLFALSMSALLLSCSSNPNSESISNSGLSTEQSSSISSVSSSSSESTPEPSSEPSSEEPSSEPSVSQESSSSASSSQDVPAGEQYHEGVEQAKDPLDNRYGFAPTISEELPRLDIVDPEGKTDWATVPDRLNKWDYTQCEVTLRDGDGETMLLEETPCQVKVRGNYTASYSKKPFRLKFDKKQSMLGLNGGKKFKSWVLLADVKDASFARNATAFYLGKTILGSDGYYSSDYRPVEVYINGTYWGVYLLAEQQEAKGGRVDIDDPEDRDPLEGEEVYSGGDTGYFVEYDGYGPEEREKVDGDPVVEISYHNDARFQTLSGKWTQNSRCGGGPLSYLTVKSPDGKVISQTQLDACQAYFENVYNLMYEASYNNKFYQFNDTNDGLVASDYESAQECIEAAVEIDSLIDTYIIQEITCDPDIGWSSFYLDVDLSPTGNKKLRFEAPWDYDSALGIKDAGGDGKRFYASECTNPWLVLLQRQNWFQQKIKAKWQDLMDNNVPFNALHYIDAFRVLYNEAYKLDYQRWGRSEGSGEWRESVQRMNTQVAHSDYLFSWLRTRFNWLSKQWGDGTEIVTGDLPVNPSSGTMGNEFDPSWQKKRYEAEDCDYTGGTVKTKDSSASGGKYIGELEGHVGIEISFNATSVDEGTGYLKVGLSKRNYVAYLNDWYEFEINGTVYEFPLRQIPSISGNEQDYHTWVEMDIGSFPIQAGNNRITLRTIGGGTNFDYFDLYSSAGLL